MTPLPARRLAVLLLLACASTACGAIQRDLAFEPYDTSYSGPRQELALGRVSNSSSYLRGIFTGGPDRLGNQARALLELHLARTRRFDLCEPELSGEEDGLLITGRVTELGPLDDRTEATVFGAVTLNVVDARTSRVLFFAEGEHERKLSDAEAARFRSSAEYDAKVIEELLDRALSAAVGQLVAGLERGAWPLD